MKKFIKENFDLVRVLVGVILFIPALFLKQYLVPHLILLILSYFITSYEIYIKAFNNIKKGIIFDENALMIIATIGAFCIKEYSEAVLVMLLYTLGEYLSDKASDHSRDSITSLLDLRSDLINLRQGKDFKEVDIKLAKVDDIFLVKPGESVPLDGIIEQGTSLIDTSSLTGESALKKLTKGDTILSGTINMTAPLIIRATSEYTTSTTAKIMELIENSDNHKAQKERFITRFSKIYTPVVVILALLFALIPPLVFKQDLHTWIYRALELLVISCPCALVISIPLSYFSGIGKCSKEGIIVKGSKELESLANINIIALDKTGTITNGNLKIEKLTLNSSLSNADVISILAHAEYYSNHPIARALRDEFKDEIVLSRIKDFKEVSGYGIKAKIDGLDIVVGSYKWLEKNDLKVSNPDHSKLYAIYNNEHIATVEVSDFIKDSAYTLSKNLNRIGIDHLVILSGDDLDATKYVADKVNISKYFATLLPTDKVSRIEELKNEGNVAFVGDGINDAPSMKLADVGIAMGGIGSDATIEASDVVLMNDDLSSVYKAIKIAKITKTVVLTNLIFAIGFKVIMMILALLGITSMYLAVFADVGITLLLILHSLTIMIRKIKAH